MHETWVRSLGQEGPLEEGVAAHSSTLAWRIPKDREAWQATFHRVTKSWTCVTRHSKRSGRGAGFSETGHNV